MAENALKDYRKYEGITEAWELVRTGLVVIRDTMYKLELWHSHSNLDIPYYVPVYVDDGGVWRRMNDAPFSAAPDPEIAMGTAMAFLSERAAA